MTLSNRKKNSGIVYSTESGRMCPDCGMAVGLCECCRQGAIIEGDGIVRIGRETKGRKGKAVTVIWGVMGSKTELKGLCRQLKAKCGCGGTVKDGVIEIQGDHRDHLMDELKKKGFEVKKSGG